MKNQNPKKRICEECGLIIKGTSEKHFESNWESHINSEKHKRLKKEREEILSRGQE